jgi:putative RNA 2'-phosphotransferase
MNTILTEKSKMLSFILRHKPESIGLTLYEDAWAEISDLLGLLNQRGNHISFDDVMRIISLDDNKRFELSEDKTRIRASYGHSLNEIAVHRIPKTPPDVLFHGTAKRFLDSIKTTGILPKERHYVHLTENIHQAAAKGKRYGSPVVLQINAKIMHQDGFQFFEAADSTWLTNFVPVDYFAKLGTP